jgi:DNA polymerase II
LLTSENVDIKGKHYIRYFGVSESGPFEVLITKHLPSFYVCTENVPDLPTKFQHSINETKLKNFFDEPISEMFFHSNSDRNSARLKLSESELYSFEADVKPPERVLMDKGIFAFVSLSNPESVRHRGDLLQWIDPQMENCPEELEIAFSSLSIDIETGKKGQLFSIALHWQNEEEEKKIVLMSRPPISPKEICGLDLQCFETEGELLQEFVRLTQVFDPDLIIGWNVVGFDFKFILEKMKTNRIRPLFGRNNSELRIYNAGGGMAAHVNGRVVLDIPRALRMNFFQFESFGLEKVAQKVLGEGKLIHSGAGKWEEIERQYFHEPELLAEYNMQDSVLVTKIMHKTGILDLLIKRSRISGLLLPRVGGSTAAFDHQMIPALHKFGYVALNVEDVDYGSSSHGGHVFEPSVGLHENVIVLDFKSLYPSIIMTFKIDPISRHLHSKNGIETPEGFCFSSTEHALPAIIEKLMSDRKKAKEISDPQLSQAVKILMNSFYGVMGSTGSRFYHPDLPEAITSTGRYLLETCRFRLEELGYEVLYGDTDSVFVKLKTGEEIEFDRSASNLASTLNIWLQTKIKDDFGLESHLEIEYEKYFRKFFLPPSRSGATGSKKRYVGLIKDQVCENMVFTGMEYVRSDWTRIAKDFQFELYRRVFAEEELREWIATFVKTLKTGKWDDKLVYQKRLTKSPEEYTKTTPPHVKAARLILEKDPKASFRRIEFIVTNEGPIPTLFEPQNPDYNHYIEKQIKPLANTVLPFFDLEFDDIISDQPSLGF